MSSGSYYILCAVSSSKLASAVSNDLLAKFGDFFTVEMASSGLETTGRLRVMSRIGRKVALLVVEQGLTDVDSRELLKDVIHNLGYPHLPFLILSEPESKGQIESDIEALSHPFVVMDKNYDRDELFTVCRRLLTDLFAKRETRDLLKFTKVLDLERLSEDFVELDNRHASYQVQMRDFHAGLFRTPWKTDDELLDELIRRIGDILVLDDIRCSFMPGDVILTEGEPNAHLYLVESGLVDMFKQVDGEEIVIGELGPGKFVGTLSFIEGRESYATTVAVRQTTLLKMGATDFRTLQNRDTGLSSLFFNQVSRAMASRIRQQSELQVKVRALNKQISRERDELQAALEKLDIAHMKLIESERMALLGEFVAGIAHELNNPAGALLRGSEQLSQTILELFEGTRDFSERDLAVVRKFGLTCLKGSISEPPRPLGDIRRDIRKHMSIRGEDYSREVARNLAEFHLSREAMAELQEMLRATDEDEKIIKRIAAYHHIGQGLRHISVCAERVSAIVSSLRSYSRPDNAEAVEIEIATGIEDTLMILGHQLRDITVEKRYEKVGQIRCKPAELNQVWTNIIANAAEALSGKGIITIRVSKLGSDKIAVDIIDNGPGISEENMSRIWELNFTTKTGAASFGLGLGLAISKNIIERSGGSISVESKPGHTWFRTILPVAVEHTGEQQRKK